MNASNLRSGKNTGLNRTTSLHEELKESIFYLYTNMNGTSSKIPLSFSQKDTSCFASGNTVLNGDWTGSPFLDREVILVEIWLAVDRG
jgi:hypothetical protein